MVSFKPQIYTHVVNNHISIKAGSSCSGYSQQYLHRLLRQGKLAGLKLGQVWLIDLESFEEYLVKVENAKDRRFGPQ